MAVVLHRPSITLMPFRSLVDNVMVTMVPSEEPQVLSLRVYILVAVAWSWRVNALAMNDDANTL